MTIQQAIASVSAAAKDIWHSLSRKTQITLTFGAGAAMENLCKVFADPAASCFQWVCIRHDLGSAIGAGVTAVWFLHVRAGPGPHAGETPYLGS